jgi:molybdenum cofactor cytidylyltransferase
MMKVKPTAGIILAAGASTRYGEPKQLLRLKDKCMLEWVLDAALNSKLNRVVLVLGYAHQKILQALGEKSLHSRLLVAINSHYKKGQSISAINILLERFWADDKDICVPLYRGKRKTPALFRHRFYNQLMEVKGDTGARQLIDDNPDRVLAVEMDNPICFFDIDTRQDYEKLKKKLEQSTEV